MQTIQRSQVAPLQTQQEPTLPPAKIQLCEHRVLLTPNAPAPGNYSQARVVELGTHAMVFTAGQTGNDPKTDLVVEGGIGPQTRQAMENLKAIMEAAGGSLDDVTKITVFMKNMAADKPGFEKEYKSFFPSRFPARSLVEVKEIPLVSEDTIVEIEAVGIIARTPAVAKA